MTTYFVTYSGTVCWVGDVEAESAREAAAAAVQRVEDYDLKSGDIVYVVPREHVTSFIARPSGPTILEQQV